MLNFFFLTGGRYVMLTTFGDLYIRSVRQEDGHTKFACMTTNTLNGERQRSDPVNLNIRGKTFPNYVSIFIQIFYCIHRAE